MNLLVKGKEMEIFSVICYADIWLMLIFFAMFSMFCLGIIIINNMDISHGH